MRQQLQGLKFSAQVGEQLGSLGYGRMQDLDRQSLTARSFETKFIQDLEHRAHAALSDDGFNSIAAPQHTAGFKFAHRVRRLRFLAARMRIGLLHTSWRHDVACHGNFARHRNFACRRNFGRHGGIAWRRRSAHCRVVRGGRTEAASKYRFSQRGLDLFKCLGLDSTAAIVLIQLRQDLPGSIRVSCESVLHRTHESLCIAAAVCERIQPRLDGAFVGPLGGQNTCWADSGVHDPLYRLDRQ